MMIQFELQEAKIQRRVLDQSNQKLRQLVSSLDNRLRTVEQDMQDMAYDLGNIKAEQRAMKDELEKLKEQSRLLTL